MTNPPLTSQARRGLFIVFEGCDRSGKTTQCELLSKRLSHASRAGDRGQGASAVEHRRFPDRSTVVGNIINNYLKQTQEVDDHAIHLMFSANRWEAMPAIRETLLKGTTIVCDRYAYSGAAFTAAKGLDLEWCKQCDAGLIRPDLVIYLDVDPEAMTSRGDYGQERYEKVSFQTQVRKNYLRLQDETWKIIDAARSIDEVHRDIFEIIDQRLHSSSNDTSSCLDGGSLWK